MIEFRLLGPVEARTGGKIVDLGGPKQRAIMAYLLFRSNRVCPADEIVDAIWGGEIDRSDTLHVYVARLRKAVDPERGADPPGLIESMRPGYLIAATSDSLDLLAFDELSEKGRQAEREGHMFEAIQSWRSALSLWRGTPAADLSGFDFVDREARALHRKRRDIATDCLEMHLAQDAPESVIAEAGPLIEEDPYDERVRFLQMLAFYRLGRQREALATYQDISQLLLDELGISPTDELQQLELRILQQDPTLLDRPVPPVDGTATIRSEPSPLPMAELVDLANGARHVLQQTITTLGRLHDRDIYLADEKVSRRHAEIRRAPHGFRLVDVGSTNGTLVNGEEVAEAELVSGDEIAIGNTILRFESATPDTTD